ncbi:DUF4834 family protein [Flavobacterium sp. MFBS3-15]|uniref:DUF4834 family protein n=1 Tax=Flavobacterium sp. MFBS3-15 TaxID=2989816 RepID=UPI00223576B6|nr:DUF4834 family protein [Flavobacterium sp. MFBS3-15]MCW4468048.1 DUF4834 family protein [Flavobacterium sp. MFBS3-15]|tara:strand:- start:182 stop:439 length:258 start_codon:yes stop_codon:yes gene_type:complete
MDTASFSGFLRTIAILILVYYAIRIAFRLLAPVLVQQVVKKAQQNFYDQQQNMQQQYQQQSGTSSAEKPKEKKKVGEYIDFEEIE